MFSDTLLQKIDHFCQNYDLLSTKSHILLGLSGGPDSVCLLHVLLDLQKKYGFFISAAHLDHEWRANSADDVTFCQELCQKFNVPFIAQKISELTVSFKCNGSQEELGRKYRRHFLEQVKNEIGANTIALAHHADDQAETFFMRLLRGSSLTGLTSMKPKERGYIRPLLSIYKKEILDFLQKKNISYLSDPTNADDKYLRSRIRTYIIPAFRATDNRFDFNFATTLKRLQETELFLNQLAEKEYNTIIRQQGIHIADFLLLNQAFKHRILVKWFCHHQVKFPVSERFFNEVIRFFNAKKSDEHNIHHQWKLVKKDGFCSIHCI